MKTRVKKWVLALVPRAWWKWINLLPLWRYWQKTKIQNVPILLSRNYRAFHQEQANFWGTKDFCPNFPKLARKIVAPLNLCEYFLMKPKVFMRFCTRWAPFCPAFSETLPRFQGILRRFQRFSRIFPRFPQIFPRFWGILPGFSSNQNFWGCTCTPASYTTAFSIFRGFE